MAQTSSGLQQSNPQNLPRPPDQPVEVQMPQQDSHGTLAKGVEALEVNSSSRSPPERPMKPVACFYVLYREPDDSAKKEHYQAVYVTKREVKELLISIAAKYNFEPTQILQMISVNQKGFNIKVDDDFVRELPEGQDMILEFSRITAPVDAVLDGEQGSAQCS
ncbi:hypothetical protein ONS95_004485 [Cadophora gregata]|uniref:uncharacterized protein n=1 Tax=Cadophora gregata TaxID=51156 RepID=UPI0026DAB8D2|nr:uncharacterized protein ONS95_004485 [Cadophora gregata]KAK0105976.1 hypothetical protein ONS95_004485 [Cadophora gregata]